MFVQWAAKYEQTTQHIVLMFTECDSTVLGLIDLIKYSQNPGEDLSTQVAETTS